MSEQSNERVGIARWGHSLVYAWRSGWLRWAPQWVKDAIVTAWNTVTCWLYGHATFTHPEDSPYPGQTWCIHCDRRIS